MVRPWWDVRYNYPKIFPKVKTKPNREPRSIDWDEKDIIAW